MSKAVHVQSHSPSQSRATSWRSLAFTALLSAGVALLAQSYLPRHVLWFSKPLSATPNASAVRQCRPPMPNLFSQSPLLGNESRVESALKSIDAFVRESFAQNEIDGLALAIVTPEGAIYETGLGVLRANETDHEKRGIVDKHSIFRIASGSKLFAVLETLILREKGALQWDDPVDKYFPEFTYVDGGWAELAVDSTPSKPKAPITLRQLASHMSGLSREYPRGNMDNWPHSMEGLGPPPLNGCPFPTLKETIEGLAKYPLIAPTYTYPIYSNAGMAVLGQAAVAANAAFERTKGVSDSPSTWKALAQRDIFDALGLNGSAFIVTPENKAHVAVAARHSEEVDLDFLDVMACSGGQMSSLSDYIKLMQTILDPTRPESLLPPHVIREWLRPQYVWTDETTEVGLLWEIEKILDSYGRPIRIYAKHGVLEASRSVFSINQDMSYGVALLMTGSSPIASNIVLDIFRKLQPALDNILAQKITDLYAGRWRPAPQDADENSEIVMKVEDGSVWITSLVLNGTDVLRLTQEIPQDDKTRTAMPITLWPTGRLHEFRMMVGAPELGTLTHTSCWQYWVAVDSGFSRGYPMDLIYFTEGDEGLVLHVPSADVKLVHV